LLLLNDEERKELKALKEYRIKYHGF